MAHDDFLRSNVGVATAFLRGRYGLLLFTSGCVLTIAPGYSIDYLPKRLLISGGLFYHLACLHHMDLWPASKAQIMSFTREGMNSIIGNDIHSRLKGREF